MVTHSPKCGDNHKFVMKFTSRNTIVESHNFQLKVRYQSVYQLYMYKDIKRNDNTDCV